MNPQSSAGVSPASLYESSKLTRDGLTIFKRYTHPEATYYHKFEYRKKQHLLKLCILADDSFALAKKLRREIKEGRFQILEALRDRTPSSTLAQLFTRYETNARGAIGISKATVNYTINATRTLFRTLQPDLTNEEIGRKPSTDLNAALLEQYKTAMLERAGVDQLAQDRAAVSANTTIRQARSLFCQKLPPAFYLGLVLPDVPALKAVRMLPAPHANFIMPPPELIAKIVAALPDLKASDPNAYRVYLLSMGVGLRAGESAAARARWLEDHTVKDKVITLVRVQTETDFRPKGKRQRTIPVSPAIAAEIRQLIIPTIPASTDGYILTGTKTERERGAFERFGAWLKTLGWTRVKKSHEFRKIFGSHVAHQAGLRAAQGALGHASYRTTETHYVGSIELAEYTIPAFG